MSSARRLSTGPLEARLLMELERAQIPVFSLQRDRGILADFEDAQISGALHSLSAKGSLVKLESGKYLVVPRAARGSWTEHPFVIASGIAPTAYYISYWSALSHHQLTNQLPRVVHIALPDRQKASLSYYGWTYRFVSLARRKFFGFKSEEFSALNGSATVEVSVGEPEKALLDSLERPEYAGGIQEVIQALGQGVRRQIVSVPRLLDYARRMGSASLLARLGYLLDRLGVEEAQDLLPLVRRRGLIPTLSVGGDAAKAHLDRRWNLYVDVPESYFEEGPY